jgi:hypothetical protein
LNYLIGPLQNAAKEPLEVRYPEGGLGRHRSAEFVLPLQRQRALTECLARESVSASGLISRSTPIIRRMCAYRFVGILRGTFSAKEKSHLYGNQWLLTFLTDQHANV